MNAYQEWRFQLPAAIEETLTAELWRCGTLGLEVREAEGGKLIVAYFSDPLADDFDFDLEAWRQRGVERLAHSRFDDDDWMATYRAHIAPLSVGRFVIHSGEPEDAAAVLDAPTSSASQSEPTVHLRIPARTAFGTGSHESTRLALAWLEDLPLAGRRVLDVGTGSGILALAALVLEARRVVAYDIDAQSVCVARTNCALNAEVLGGRRPALLAATPGALRRRPWFDLALVNVLPERIVDHYPEILARLKPGATVISSGNLVQQRGELLDRFAGWGWGPLGEKVEGEWLAWALRRTTDL